MNIPEIGFKESLLFQATDLIETAREFQTHLTTLSPDLQPEAAAYAIDAMGDPREIHGASKIWVHAMGAAVLNIGLTFDDELYHGTYFDDSIFKGRFSRLAYVRHALMNSLCLTLLDTSVVHARDNHDFEGTQVKSGVFVPVHAVESILVAA